MDTMITNLKEHSRLPAIIWNQLLEEEKLNGEQ